MDLKDQLKNLFPDHVPAEEDTTEKVEGHGIWLQEAPIVCKFEKRKGKVNTILEGYQGSDEDFKKLARQLKSQLSVGGSVKNGYIIIQGDYRDRIMNILQQLGFKTKRVGG